MEVSDSNTRSDESVDRQDPENAAEMELIRNLEVPRSAQPKQNGRGLPTLGDVDQSMSGLDKIPDFSFDNIKSEVNSIGNMQTEPSYMRMRPEPSFMANMQTEQSFRGNMSSEATSPGTPKQPAPKFKFMKTLSTLQTQFNVLSRRATIKKREEPNSVQIKPSSSIESYTDLKAEKGNSDRVSTISRVPNSRSSKTERVIDSQNHQSRASSTSKYIINER
jgi:hypothetical protein